MSEIGKRPSATADLAAVRGQTVARRAVEIAAAGGHPLLLLGPAGSGKSLLVACLAGLLERCRELGESAGGQVLCLDTISGLRTGIVEPFPSRPGYQLVITLRPCPCGRTGNRRLRCRCGLERRRNHLARIEASLLEEVELVAELDLPLDDCPAREESSRMVARRVLAARRRQAARSAGSTEKLPGNALLSGEHLDGACPLDARAHRELEVGSRRLGLACRHREGVLRVARTVADLEGSEAITAAHLAEAMHYRRRHLTSPPRVGAPWNRPPEETTGLQDHLARLATCVRDTEASWQERLHRLAETLPVDPQVEAMREAGDPVMTLDALARLEQEHLTRGLLREAGKLPAPPLALRPAPRATRTP